MREKVAKRKREKKVTCERKSNWFSNMADAEAHQVVVAALHLEPALFEEYAHDAALAPLIQAVTAYVQQSSGWRERAERAEAELPQVQSNFGPSFTSTFFFNFFFSPVVC